MWNGRARLGRWVMQRRGRGRRLTLTTAGAAVPDAEEHEEGVRDDVWEEKGADAREIRVGAFLRLSLSTFFT